MMLRFSFDLDQEADAIEAAVEKVLKDGYRTIDIMSEGKKQIGTKGDGRSDRSIYLDTVLHRVYCSFTQGIF